MSSTTIEEEEEEEEDEEDDDEEDFFSIEDNKADRIDGSASRTAGSYTASCSAIKRRSEAPVVTVSFCSTFIFLCKTKQKNFQEPASSFECFYFCNAL